jgi:DNA-binding LytR/AlgR family response regulator
MRIVIVEDEEPAAQRLARIIKEQLPEVLVEAQLGSVAEATEWFRENKAPDLAFFDIQLGDGISFEIFKKATVDCPVIFTTAYDQYAIEAFKVNSIAYLLKPVSRDDLAEALEKYSKMKEAFSPPAIDMSNLLEAITDKRVSYKERFVVRYGEIIRAVETKNVAYFFTEDKMAFLITGEGKKYPIDNNMEELEKLLDPKTFFRINRQFIISYHAIDEMVSYSKSRVMVKLKPLSKHDTIVSTERSPNFKAWLAGDK